MDNRTIASRLEELARLTAVADGDPNSFRVRAYQAAARTVEAHGGPVASLSAAQLAGLKGIGRSTASKVRELVDTGSMAKLDELRSRFPREQLALLEVPGLGPRTLLLLDEVLGVHDVDGLRAAIDDGRLESLPGMGERTRDNLRAALDRVRATSKQDRRPIHRVLPDAEQLVAGLAARDDVVAAEHAGSLRRFRETIGDVDILVATSAPEAVTAAFTAHELVHEVVASGPTKTSAVTWDGLQVDLRVVTPEAYGAALLYFTGSRAHNIALRQRALDRGWVLNEYGLADADGTVLAADEEGIYGRLGLQWVTPELREDAGEIELAANGDLPERLVVADLRGDLHDHTDASGDGRDSLDAMVDAARARGLDYLAITDHAEDLRINGISRAAMKAQRSRLRALQEDLDDIRLLHGAELNIGVDGSLDYDQAFLETFDWCVASVHSHFNRGVAEQTRRIVAAMRNPAVTAIGHLSGRRLGKRPGIDLDIDAVLDAAVETGTAIEINCSLPRLDATVEVIREGARRGVVFVISTDAHATHELANHRHGVAHARRAGLSPARVANTWPTDRFLSWVADVKTA